MSNEVEMTLFESAAVLPAQMSWGAHCDGNTSGARALMLAILAEAMSCVERGRRRRHPRTRQLAAEAETWMRSDCREWLFSFASISEVLGIDANAVRAHFLLSTVEDRPNGRGAPRAAAAERSPGSRDVGRLLPQRASTRGPIATGSAREPIRRSGRGGGIGSGVGVRARLEVA